MYKSSKKRKGRKDTGKKDKKIYKSLAISKIVMIDNINQKLSFEELKNT